MDKSANAGVPDESADERPQNVRLARVNGKSAAFHRGPVEHSAQFRAGLGAGPRSAMEAARARAELVSA